jgi:indolepyruvate ferredoxin oxidoreductase alpha subunit
MTGANGGLIVVSADDPSMHSSQNEQDSRFYGKFALLPILEPSNQQEAYDMVLYGFSLSEKFKLPVLLRITTRLAHSRSGVNCQQPRRQNDLKLPDNMKQFLLLPAIARKLYKTLIQHQEGLLKESEDSLYNFYTDGKNKKLGIIACGLAYNYLLENFPDRNIPYPVLKISQYPMPRKYVEKIAKECDELLVLEDGMPFIEDIIKGYLSAGLKIHGRLDNTIPRDGEMNPNKVAAALGIAIEEGGKVPDVVVSRPPSLCVGCPHTDSFLALNEVMEQYGKGRVFSDIGCYTLGALEPLDAIYSCVDMGASVTMAKGAADAGLVPSVAVIGDSTFTHSGITGLLDAVNDNSPITVVILDNATTAMTGGQTSSGFGKLDKICKGLGVDEEHIHIIKPLVRRHKDNVDIFRKEVAYNGVSVIIAERECIQTLNKRMREKFLKKVTSDQ